MNETFDKYLSSIDRKFHFEVMWDEQLKKKEFMNLQEADPCDLWFAYILILAYI